MTVKGRTFSPEERRADYIMAINQHYGVLKHMTREGLLALLRDSYPTLAPARYESKSREELIKYVLTQDHPAEMVEAYYEQ